MLLSTRILHAKTDGGAGRRTACIGQRSLCLWRLQPRCSNCARDGGLCPRGLLAKRVKHTTADAGGRLRSAAD